MAVKLGTNDITTFKIGSNQVDKLYMGSTEVWSASSLSDYQQVEWIGGTGTQHINTGVNYSEFDYVEMKFSVNDTNENYLFGARASNTAQFYLYGYFDRLHLGIQNDDREVWQTRIGTTEHTIVADIANQTATMDNAYTLSSMTYYTGTIPYNMYLFNINQASLYDSGNAKIYELILKKNGVEVYHFVPCYRIADNEIGMLDTVNQVFYTNDGTGTFEKGSDVN